MTPTQALMDELHFAMRGMQLHLPKGVAEDLLRARFHNYEPRIGRLRSERYACPKCFLREGEKYPLQPTPGTDEYDLLACPACSNEYVIPFE